MKTTLAILITGLIFLATPMLATAHGGDRHKDGPRQTKGWVKDRHDSDHYRHNRDHKWERRAKRHFKKHKREHRRERQHYARKHHRPAYESRHRAYAKSGVYVNPGLLLGIPRVVFHFDW